MTRRSYVARLGSVGKRDTVVDHISAKAASLQPLGLRYVQGVRGEVYACSAKPHAFHHIKTKDVLLWNLVGAAEQVKNGLGCETGTIHVSRVLL